jgi:hypothetical protein
VTYDLLVSDPHTHPDDNFDRFDWLGRMILEDKPRRIICIGDFLTLDSMSSYDKFPKSTLAEDCAAGIEAQRRMFGPIMEWNKRQRETKHRPHYMERVMIKGNHEERADRARKDDPHRWASVVNLDDVCGFNTYWSEVYEYGDIKRFSGIDYTHCMIGMSNRALALNTVAKQTSTHLIQGHSHSLQTVTVPVPDGVRFVMSAPAFMPVGYVPDYAKRSVRGWTYGLLKVRPEGPSEAPGIEYVSMKEMERKYGD